MAAGSDPKPPGPSLLERWRASVPAEPAAPRRTRPPPSPPAPAVIPAASPAPAAVDPASLLRAIDEAVTAALAPALARAALASLDPVREALGAPAASRDPGKLTAAFEQAEDILEALLLVSPPRALPEG